MKEHPNYENGDRCEFRADGKLRGGKVLEQLCDVTILGGQNAYSVGYYGPGYREIILPKNKVTILKEAL